MNTNVTQSSLPNKDMAKAKFTKITVVKLLKGFFTKFSILMFYALNFGNLS